ncbi:Usher syndrome type-1C protein-binding protein 1 PDZ domain, partial [Trinorchestia longiramus]
DVAILVQRLRAENKRLQQSAQLSQRTKVQQKQALDSTTAERDKLKRQVQVQQLQQQQLQPAIRCSTQQVSDAVAVKGLLRTSQSSIYRESKKIIFPACGSLSPLPPGDRPPSAPPDPQEGGGPAGGASPAPDPLLDYEDPPIICKMAERVRLKKSNALGQVTGCDLRHLGVSNTAVAEQLIASLNEESQSQELFYALATAGGTLVPHERLKEYEVEVERLNAKLDHLKAQNDVLSITLNESKAHCDHLSILMGKYESNSSALQLTVSTLDMTVESLEVLVALLESELGLLLATYRASEGGSSRWKDGPHKDLFGAMKLSQEHRRATENVARHLLSRCERELSVALARIDHQSEGSSTSDEISRTEEIRIRQLVNRLKDDRRNIASSVVHLESLLTDPLTAHHPLPEAEALKLDLENSVLMQELTAVREDRAELRAQVYLLEREKAGLELRLGTCEARETALVATIDLLKAQADRTSNLM